jgi:hypothetical protein
MSDFYEYDEETELDEEYLDAMQGLVDSGQAWLLEGSVGRLANDLIEGGYITLGEVGHHDYWGNYVPSRHEVVEGTKGSVTYVERMREERDGA